MKTKRKGLGKVMKVLMGGRRKALIQKNVPMQGFKGARMKGRKSRKMRKEKKKSQISWQRSCRVP